LVSSVARPRIPFDRTREHTKPIRHTGWAFRVSRPVNRTGFAGGNLVWVEKTARNYLAVVTLAATVLWAR